MIWFWAGPALAGQALVDLPFAELSLAKGTPPAATEDIPIDGPFRLIGVVAGVRSYEAPIPVRPRSLFFESPPEGMTLSRGAVQFRFAGDVEDGVRSGTWDFSADSVVVRLKAEVPPPKPGEFVLTYPSATEREDALWRARSPSGDDSDFVVRSAQVDDVTRRGLYLPAPTTAGWDVAIPEGGVLRMQVGILPPEVADGTRSDGATVTVRVGGDVAATFHAAVGQFEDVRVPLGKWAGAPARLTIATSDADTERDHVFIGAPTVYVPADKPKRTLLVFIDTLRRDHLGTYGYTRGASPVIDGWAKNAVVFDDARSVAPWTLPSSRAALSGLQPELWEGARTLPMRLAQEGWATAAYVGNVYLSSNFDMADGWGEHGCINWPYARLEVDRALDFLDRHADQDSLLMVHFMDMHLPYKEPSAFRGLYEGTRPVGLFEGFTRNALLTASKGNREKVKKYLVARYDQNLRYVDSQVERLLRAVGDDATVVLFADHGEEFFDHGDLEHGHTLYDELLRIPLAVRSPGLAARRVETPVSLLDLTPTVLDLLGIPDPKLQGRSLLGLARGEPDPDAAARPIGFGRPLYGNEAWGSVVDGQKYISRSGKELLFDLKKDAGEATNLRPDGDPTRGRAAMADALQRPTAIAYRLAPKGKGSGAFAVEMEIPAGIEAAWVGDDPTNHSEATITRDGDTKLTATFVSARGSHREVFVVPRGDAVALASTVTIRVARAGLAPVPLTPLPFDGYGESLGHLAANGRTLDVTYTAIPKPVGKATRATDLEMQGALEALGYAARDEGSSGSEGAEEPAAESDTDHDGIGDAKDKCPTDAEDKDSYQDEDGCPETGPEQPRKRMAQPRGP